MPFRLMPMERFRGAAAFGAARAWSAPLPGLPH
jgi:hypothetical protein